MNCEKCFEEYCDNLDEEETNRIEKELAHNGQSICGTGKSFPCPQGHDKYSHGGYRPGSGAKKTLPDNATPRSIRLTDAEYLAVKEFIKSLRSENKMKIEEIKKAAKEFANKAVHVDNCERLGYEGLLDAVKADEMVAFSRLVKSIDAAGMTIEEAVKAAKLPWPIEKTLKTGGRW